MKKIVFLSCIFFYSFFVATGSEECEKNVCSGKGKLDDRKDAGKHDFNRATAAGIEECF